MITGADPAFANAACGNPDIVGTFMRGGADVTITKHGVTHDPLVLSTVGKAVSVQHFDFDRLISGLDSTNLYCGATLQITVLGGTPDLVDPDGFAPFVTYAGQIVVTYRSRGQDQDFVRIGS